MKLVLVFALSLATLSANASDLYCEGKGYEIKTSQSAPGSWEKISVIENGAVLVADLNENGSSFIQKDDVNGDSTQMVRAATVRDRVISSLTLAIKLHQDGGYTGIGSAVIYDGSKTTTVDGLDCKTP